MSVGVGCPVVRHLDAHDAFDCMEGCIFTFSPVIFPVMVNIDVSESEMFVEYFVNFIDPLSERESVCVCVHNDLGVGEAEVLH